MSRIGNFEYGVIRCAKCKDFRSGPLPARMQYWAVFPAGHWIYKFVTNHIIDKAKLVTPSGPNACLKCHNLDVAAYSCLVIVLTRLGVNPMWEEKQ